MINRNNLALILIGILTIVLWQFQLGRYFIYPFTILGTWFHEMGHGLTAIILGGSFEQLKLFPDGSGVASHSGTILFGRFGVALVAAGGPVFPILIGAALILFSVKIKSANILLLIFSLLIILSVGFWVRSFFGIISLTLISAFLIIISLKANNKINLFIIQLLGIEACVSFYLNIGYYFSSGGTIEGTTYYSDTQVIANNLLLPYWFWGGTIVLISVFVIIFLLKAMSENQNFKPKNLFNNP